MSTLARPEPSARTRSGRSSDGPAPVPFIRGVVAVLRRDLAREMKSWETLPSMVLFAVLVLFICSLGAAPDSEGEVTGRFGPAVLWVTLFFSASIGVHRAFANEKENGAFLGLLAAPVDRTCIYFGKLASTFIFSGMMGAVTLGGFVIFYNPPLGGIAYLALLMGIVLVDYLALGILLSAMTAGLRGGEVLLRILLFPLMMPVFVAAIRATLDPLSEGKLPPDPIAPVGFLIGLGAVYLAAGTLFFEKVVEE